MVFQCYLFLVCILFTLNTFLEDHATILVVFVIQTSSRGLLTLLSCFPDRVLKH